MKTNTMFFIGGCSGSSSATSGSRARWDPETPSGIRRQAFLRMVYGGNTTSFLLRHQDTIILVDQGEGVVAVSSLVNDMLNAEGKTETTVHIIQTHYHLDHVRGIPFNSLFFRPGVRIVTHSPNLTAWRASEKPQTWTASGPYLEGLIPRYFSPQSGLWPVSHTFFRATLEHREFVPGESFQIGMISVSTLPLPHPDGCCGYRLDVPATGPVVIATDHEPVSPPDPTVAEFFSGARMLLIDMQYDDEEYEGKKAIGGRTQSRVGWGHGTPNLLFPLIARCARQPQVIRVVHHDPLKCDGDLDLFHECSLDTAEKVWGNSGLPNYAFAKETDISWL